MNSTPGFGLGRAPCGLNVPVTGNPRRREQRNGPDLHLCSLVRGATWNRTTDLTLIRHGRGVQLSPVEAVFALMRCGFHLLVVAGYSGPFLDRMWCRSGAESSRSGLGVTPGGHTACGPLLRSLYEGVPVSSSSLRTQRI